MEPSKYKLKLRQRLNQKLLIRLVIAFGIGSFTIISGVLIYVQMNTSKISKAEHMNKISHENLPVDLKVEELVISETDTLSEGGRYKIAKPLSETPKIK